MGRISSGYFVAGIVYQIVAGSEIVIIAAPILKYMVCWTPKKVEDYAASKGWKYERIN